MRFKSEQLFWLLLLPLSPHLTSPVFERLRFFSLPKEFYSHIPHSQNPLGNFFHNCSPIMRLRENYPILQSVKLTRESGLTPTDSAFFLTKCRKSFCGLPFYWGLSQLTALALLVAFCPNLNKIPACFNFWAQDIQPGPATSCSLKFSYKIISSRTSSYLVEVTFKKKKVIAEMKSALLNWMYRVRRELMKPEHQGLSYFATADNV